MATGTVKWFSDEKGYGFLTPDEVSMDLLVHHRDRGHELSVAGGGREGVVSRAKSPVAANVQLI